MEDEIAMVFSGVMNEAMSIVHAEEVTAAAGSSWTWQSKHHQRCVNHDREAAHFRLWHDYFDDDCMYPHNTFAEGIVCGGLFSWAFLCSMYHFKIYNRIKLVCFLKFVVHEMNSKMVKSVMMVLTGREKVDVAVGWMLLPTAGTVVGERERKSWCGMSKSEV
jgi:hypothetical protein